MRDATTPGSDWVAPRQVRLHGSVDLPAFLELDALKANGVPSACQVELRDRDGRRFFVAPARLVGIQHPKASEEPTITIDVDVTLVVDPPDRERRTMATIAEIVRARKQRPKPGAPRGSRTALDERNQKIRELRTQGFPKRIIADRMNLSRKHVAQILRAGR